jgi:co-chaperonin GroES (HSP10)
LLDEKSIKPLNNNVLVRIIPPKETIGSTKLIKPASFKDEESFQFPVGRVLAVGPGSRATKTGERIPIDIRVGDIIFIRKHMKEPLFMFEQDLVMIDAALAMATVEPGITE